MLHHVAQHPKCQSTLNFCSRSGTAVKFHLGDFRSIRAVLNNFVEDLSGTSANSQLIGVSNFIIGTAPHTIYNCIPLAIWR
jgi:hypothetical protein